MALKGRSNGIKTPTEWHGIPVDSSLIIKDKTLTLKLINPDDGFDKIEVHC